MSNYSRTIVKEKETEQANFKNNNSQLNNAQTYQKNMLTYHSKKIDNLCDEFNSIKLTSEDLTKINQIKTNETRVSKPKLKRKPWLKYYFIGGVIVSLLITFLVII